MEQEVLNIKSPSEKKKFDLETRLIDFAVRIIRISEQIDNSPAGKHISGQVVRSGSSPALHYGEAQAAESRTDFIHKLKILLKELRETMVSLKIAKKVPLTKDTLSIDKALAECNELIAIFNKSIETAKKNNVKK